ncbi:MAG: EF-hand domain-containing protein [Synechococcales bacterium]|nr:EF-hand domain-containing protein [Synechococcales bacterium]
MLTDLQKIKLTKLFGMYDAQNNGSLDVKDFENIAKKIAHFRNWSSRSPQYIILYEKLMRKWKSMLQRADTTHNKKVSLAEWLTYYDEALADQGTYANEIQTLMESLFESFDRDNDGLISQEEWGELLCVYSISPVYAPLIFSRLDGNEDGHLSKDEVMQLLQEFFYSNDPDTPANIMFGPCQL